MRERERDSADAGVSFLFVDGFAHHPAVRAIFYPARCWNGFHANIAVVDGLYDGRRGGARRSLRKSYWEQQFQALEMYVHDLGNPRDWLLVCSAKGRGEGGVF